MNVRVDHLTAIVADVEAATSAITRMFGIEPCASVEAPTMTIRSFRFGEVELHLNAPRGPGVVADHLRRHCPSVHHVAFIVDDLAETVTQLHGRGFPTRGDIVETAPGIREVFIQPDATAGLWLQLIERSSDHAARGRLDPEAVESLAGNTTHRNEEPPK